MTAETDVVRRGTSLFVWGTEMYQRTIPRQYSLTMFAKSMIGSSHERRAP